MKSFTVPDFASLPSGGQAVVIGAGGGLGSAFLTLLGGSERFAAVTGLGRKSAPALDLTEEASIAAAARAVKEKNFDLRLVIDATGFLHDDSFQPEKSWRELDPAHFARAFALNATGPALLMKHFLPLLPREGKAVFATLSAKVGSIGDNQLGGWYAYRASKAALNQIVRSAAIELKRRKPQALCLALHPGTVDTGLSAPFSKQGLELQRPEEAAARLLALLDALDAGASGGFYSYRGERLPW